MHGRRLAHLQPVEQLPPDKALGAAQSLYGLLRHRQSLKAGYIHLAVGQIVGQIHPDDAEHLSDPGILQLPQNGGQLPFYVLCKPVRFITSHSINSTPALRRQYASFPEHPAGEPQTWMKSSPPGL